MVKGVKMPQELIAKRNETRRINGWFKNPEATSKKMSVGQAGRIYGTRNVTWGDKISASLLGKYVGEQSPNWRGGRTSLVQKLRMSHEYKEWRIAVFKRDDYTCVLCGQHGGELQADHIKPFASYPELRFEITNGRTLCVPCHRATPTYGPISKN